MGPASRGTASTRSGAPPHFDDRVSERYSGLFRLEFPFSTTKIVFASCPRIHPHRAARNDARCPARTRTAYVADAFAGPPSRLATPSPKDT